LRHGEIIKKRGFFPKENFGFFSWFCLTENKKPLQYVGMFLHKPVLFQEIQDLFLQLPRREVVVDATCGLGGHAAMLLSLTQTWGYFYAFDRDSTNLEQAQRTLKDIAPWVHTSFIHESFSHIDSRFEENSVDFFLYDLGVSSAHYDDPLRGFSLRFDGPLDMRFDRTKWITAKEILKNYDEKTLAKILFQFGDEKKANYIARAMIESRKEREISTTFELLDIIRRSSFDQKSPIRVFQALRIVVNEEFDHIVSSLQSAIRKLRSGWCIAVITFHSGEDRLVKHVFSEYILDEIDEVTGQTIIPSVLIRRTKKPIEPSEEEIFYNPRARSAKLRVYQKR
jgi:16S rRNA (cytosine1402-N4)-methyltransferase